MQEERVLWAAGNNNETMQRVTWELDRFKGQQGRLRIVDLSNGDWGHINADDFRFEPPPEEPRVIVPPPQSSQGLPTPLLVGGIVLAAATGVIIAIRSIRSKKAKKKKSPEIQVEPNLNLESLRVGAPEKTIPGNKVDLKPVLDLGIQEVILDNSLIKKERKQDDEQ